MAVNNEVGTIQPIAQVAELVAERAPGAVLHTDAIQAFAWLDVAEVCAGAHLVSISGHKFGGPKGVGVLAVRKGVDVEPLVLGGGQERGRRSGTQNVAGIVALATAMSLTHDERKTTVDRVGALRDRLVDGLAAQLGGLSETVPRDRKVAGQRPRVHRRRRDRGAAVPARPRGRVRVGRVVVLERCDGSVARARGDGCRRERALSACGCRSVPRRPRQMSTGRSTSSPPRSRSSAGSAMQVMVAMSGGVDSSVAAALLLEAGHEVVGVTMKLWGGESDRGCCSVSDVDDARRVAQQLGIDHPVFNFGDDFMREVVDPYVEAHASARRRTRASSATGT